MAVQAVAPGRQVAMGGRPPYVLLGPRALGGGRRRRRSLHVAGARAHGHLLADLGDGVLVVDVGLGRGKLARRAGLLPEAAVRRLGGRRILDAAGPADAEGGGALAVGAGHRHDALLRAGGRQRRLRGVELEVVGDGARLLGARTLLRLGGGGQLLGQPVIFLALLAERRQLDRGGTGDRLAALVVAGAGLLLLGRLEGALVQRRRRESVGVWARGALEAPVGGARGNHGRRWLVRTPRRSRRYGGGVGRCGGHGGQSWGVGEGDQGSARVEYVAAACLTSGRKKGGSPVAGRLGLFAEGGAVVRGCAWFVSIERSMQLLWSRPGQPPAGRIGEQAMHAR